MTHSPFRKYPFIETAFARRLQAKLHDSWDNRSWHLLVADPGAGKTTAIRDLQKRAGGRSVLAVVAPKNIEDEQALGDQLIASHFAGVLDAAPDQPGRRVEAERQMEQLIEQVCR